MRQSRVRETRWLGFWPCVSIAKRVAFYLLAYRAGSPARHDAEVEGVRLVPVAEATDALTYPGERKVMERALAALAAGGYGGPGANEEGP